MRCSDAQDRLSALLDREGDAAELDALARHVEGCDACRAELAALAGTDRALERVMATRAEPPPGYHEGLWARLEPRLGEEPGELVTGDADADLSDVRALADRALERTASQSVSAVPGLLQAPAVLGQVVLPSPPARRPRWPLGVGAGVLAAALAAFVLLGKREASPVASSLAPPPAAPAPVVEPIVEPIAPAPAEVPAEAEVAAPPPPPPPRRPAARVEKAAVEGGAPAREAASPEPPSAPKKTADEILEELTAPAAEAPAPTTRVPGNEKLGHDEIKAALSPLSRVVQGCRPAGERRTVVVVRVRVAPDGSVAAAEPVGAHASTPAGACVAGKVRAARFEPFDGPPMTLKYSYTLEADE